MQMSNPESQARRPVTRSSRTHILCHPSSNLETPTKVAKGSIGRLAFKSTLIKHPREITICQWNSIDEVSSLRVDGRMVGLWVG